MSIMVTTQTTTTLVGFHLTTPSSSTKVMLVVVLIDQLVTYLGSTTSILLHSQNPSITHNLALVGSDGTALSYILMISMFVPWYIVLIVVIPFTYASIIIFVGL